MPVPDAHDLIVARATAAGPAALAIVRADGQGAAALAERLFRPSGTRRPAESPRLAIHGAIVDPATGDLIDEGICLFFAAPHSYTGNDLVEFHLHGGPVPVRRTLEAALAAGARPAQPGEFTRRAFLNGRMDLAQAEAVADLINAQTDAAARVAAGQLGGALSACVGSARQALLELAAHLEAALDFPEEGIEPQEREALRERFERAGDMIGMLLATRRRGQLVREGARVAIVGRPNAGKSSLLNALARMERALVTPHPGTTRDTIECTIDLHGIPATLIDTAGLRESQDPVEQLGIERARREIERADLIVLVIDAEAAGGVDLSDADALASEIGRPPDIVALNKIDRAGLPAGATTTGGSIVRISALRGDGLDALEASIVRRLEGAPAGDGGDLTLAVNLRHAGLLARAGVALESARRAFEAGLSGELVMIDLREALDALGEIVGAGSQTAEAILDHIFSRFCIGK